MPDAYNTRKNREKSTKTDAAKHVPVHPVLAAMLAEWKLGGWAEMVGHAPAADDLLVPLPPDAAARATASRSAVMTTRASAGARPTCRRWAGGTGDTTTCGRRSSRWQSRTARTPT